MERIGKDEAKRLYTVAATDQATENVKGNAKVVAAYYHALIAENMRPDDALSIALDWHSVFWSAHFDHYYATLGK